MHIQNRHILDLIFYLCSLLCHQNSDMLRVLRLHRCPLLELLWQDLILHHHQSHQLQVKYQMRLQQYLNLLCLLENLLYHQNSDMLRIPCLRRYSLLELLWQDLMLHHHQSHQLQVKCQMRLQQYLNLQCLLENLLYHQNSDTLRVPCLHRCPLLESCRRIWYFTCSW